MAERTRSTVDRFMTALFSVIVIMIDGFDLQAISFVAPEIARDWALPISAFGPVFSAALAGSVIGAMSAGFIARKTGLRWVLVISLLLFGLFTLAISSIHGLLMLMALRFLVGIGLGAAVPTVMNIVACNVPKRFLATFLVVTLCGQPIGAIVGAAICARYIPIYGWHFAFYLGGAIPLILAALSFILRNTEAPVEVNGGKESGRSSARLREVLSKELWLVTALLWSCAFLTNLFLYIIVNWLPSSARSNGYSLEESVFAISLFNFGGIAGAVFIGFLMDRFGALKIMPIVYAVAGISTAMIDPTKAIPFLFLSTVFFSGLAGYGGAISLGPLTVMRYPEALRTLGTGWVLGIGRLGAVLGPLGAGYLLSSGLAIFHLFYFAAAAAALGTLCLAFLARRAAPAYSQLYG